VWNAANSREQCLFRGANIDRPTYRAASRKLKAPHIHTCRFSDSALHSGLKLVFIGKVANTQLGDKNGGTICTDILGFLRLLKYIYVFGA
jgi:hypothetical protein